MVDKKGAAGLGKLKEASVSAEKAMDGLQQLCSNIIFCSYESRVLFWHKNQQPSYKL
jgi:hypothetical protein